MRAEGNVFLSNGAETAEGAWAEYDVAGGMMRMGGQVVLTQGENAIAGDSLVINMAEARDASRAARAGASRACSHPPARLMESEAG
jgi:lipopolysaccharide export system protein LptA